MSETRPPRGVVSTTRGTMFRSSRSFIVLTPHLAGPPAGPDSLPPPRTGRAAAGEVRRAASDRRYPPAGGALSARARRPPGTPPGAAPIRATSVPTGGRGGFL